MSDDGYYAGSPYDEFDDALGDADSNYDLADDLAQHAAHSPVWQDDPVGELEPYHSDWEYYSDDYYDDDPAILARNPIDGCPSYATSNTKSRVHRRGTKRKFEDRRESQSIFRSEERRSLLNSIRGTVWAKERPHVHETFRQGQQETVSLLVDWKERFNTHGDYHKTSGIHESRRDDSWANDLGLVDMGLETMHEKVRAADDAAEGGDRSDDAEQDSDNDGSRSAEMEDANASNEASSYTNVRIPPAKSTPPPSSKQTLSKKRRSSEHRVDTDSVNSKRLDSENKSKLSKSRPQISLQAVDGISSPSDAIQSLYKARSPHRMIDNEIENGTMTREAKHANDSTIKTNGTEEDSMKSNRKRRRSPDSDGGAKDDTVSTPDRPAKKANQARLRSLRPRR